VKKYLATLIITTFILSGCNFGKKDEVEESYKFPTKEEMNEMQNDLGVNPEIIEKDKLLMVGDSNLNTSIEQIQNKPDKKDLVGMEEQGFDSKFILQNVHHSGQFPSLHPTYINPKVKAINGSYINNVIGKAWDYYGTPYELGSDRNNPSTFDCSDYIRWVHLITLGMDLPKTSASQWEYVKKFSKRKFSTLSEAKRGDLLFFMKYRGYRKEDYAGINVKAQPVGHVGIYLGDGLMIHTASQKTGGVRFDKIAGTHLQYRFIGGGKVVQ
jgi:peptidoglycan DL-endopeptidase CwlO